MKLKRNIIMGVVAAALATAAPAQTLTWQTVANNADIAPGGDPAATFRSYNQPAVNDAGTLVFRARSSVGSSAQVDGIYLRNITMPGALLKLLVRGDAVPAPNNTLYNGVPAAFTEFPSTPRIDAGSDLVATRGQHEPVWTYLLGATETRVGTSGIYAFPAGVPTTAAGLLGSAVEVDQVTLSFPWFSVPGALFGTRFDQFPGSPAVFDNRYIAFKGNYTDPVDGLGRTGIFFRDVVAVAPVPYTGLIANSNMLIPNQPPGGTTKFGSTAPPSGSNGFVFFTGLDIEEAPTMGGIYRAPVASMPALQPLVEIGGQVPGEVAGTGFRTFGEALSLSGNGQEVSFWASWGTETIQKTLSCPVDGNPDLIAFCNEQHPTGLVVDIPLNQGIFVHDAASGITTRLARTGQEGISDLLFWVFSGQPPQEGGVEPGTELARWRSSAFAALSRTSDDPLKVVFVAERNGTRGIYLREGTAVQALLKTVAEVGVTPGVSIDPMAPAGSLVSAVGVERDGFRNGRLAITASMLYVDPMDPETTLGWAGIYAASVPADLMFGDGFESLE